MFSFDAWQEVYQTIIAHKLRTFLTLLTVSWGIFMLVLLLGAGKGIQNGVERQFQDDAVNSIWVYRGKTTIPFEGHPRGRRIQFDNTDYEQIRDINGVEHITSRYYLNRELSVSYRDKYASFDIRSSHPDHQHIEKTIVVSGRFLNDIDIDRRRKVCVIGTKVRDILFGKVDLLTNPLGQYIKIDNSQYKVVGVFEDKGGRSEVEKIYIPISTAQMVYGAADRVHQIMFTVGNTDYEGSEAISKSAKVSLANRHRFDVEDERAVRLWNNLKEYQKIMDLFYWVRVFVWVIGIGTVFTGILAVSNIMVISVKERTREIGIRKALGATPTAIVGTIVRESLLVTAIAGYLGLIASLSLLEFLKQVIPENDYLYQPDVDMPVVLMVTALVIVSGTLAGFIPAWRAARVDPITALRE
jgi:putative ABC transport system permease protein